MQTGGFQEQAGSHDLTLPFQGLEPNVAKLVTELTFELYDRLNTAPPQRYGGNRELVQPNGEPLSKAMEEPKSYFIDPNDMLGGMGLNYIYPPTQVTYETLRLLAERIPPVTSIVQRRVKQVRSFMKVPINDYDIGIKVRPIGKLSDDRNLTRSEREKCAEITQFLLQTGCEYNEGRDDLGTWSEKFMRDRLYYDQACFEKVPTRDGGLHSFHAVPSESFRIAMPKTSKMTPPDVQDLKKDIKYVQVINGNPYKDYTMRELAFCIANPRSNMHVNGYGFPETEMLMTVGTSILWADEWNRNIFKQGSTLKGLLNVKGNFTKEKFAALKREYQTKFAGVHNAHKNAIFNVDELQWMPLQLSNTEMGFSAWVEYLIKLVCAFFMIDPAEINFDLRGSSQQQPIFMSNNEAQQKVSRDQGLQHHLLYVQDALNKHVVWRLNPGYMVLIVGLNAKSQEQALELAAKQVSTTHTVNEVRALDDLPPLKGGDVILNAIYTGRLAAIENQPQPGQQQPGMPPGAMPGMPGAQQQPPQPGQQQDGNPFDKLSPQQPGAAEQQAGQNLQAAAGGKNGASKKDEVKHVSSSVVRVLGRDDWANSSLFMSTTKRQDYGDRMHKALFGTAEDGAVYDELDVSRRN